MKTTATHWLVSTGLFIMLFGVQKTGCLRRSDDVITEDYDEIDRKSPPVFINNTRTRVVVAAGRKATLECRVKNQGHRTVSWIRKRDLHILTVNSVLYTSDKRFSAARHPPETGDKWVLSLEDARTDDSGIYECQVNTEPKKSKSFRLQVVVSNAHILGDRDVLVQMGSDINLTCKAQDSPEAPTTVVWYKNGMRVDELVLSRGGISVVTESKRRTSQLLVSKVNKNDAGNYTCAPTNAKTDSVTVHVIEGADPRANVMASSAYSYGVSSALLLVSVMYALK